MLAAALGLGAGLSWGVADFVGGLKTRKLALLAVLLVSQGAGLVLVAALVVARGEDAPAGEFVLYAALAGAAGTIALAAFYRGLAVGAMGVVAPISATAAAIPVAVGLATGERPSTIQGLGIAVALVGVAVASREPDEVAERGGRVAAGAGLALLAALGFGTFFVVMDKASDGGVLWAILVNRSSGVALLLVATLAIRPSLALGRDDLVALLVVGVFDIGAQTMFAAASTKGLVSLVAVLASLYPVATVMLARVVLRERIHRIQQAGAVGALAGVVLITAG